MTWIATAVDAVDGNVPVTCTPEVGFFPVGDTVVTCTATDTAGNSASGSFTVTVSLAGPEIVQLEAGSYYTCAVLGDGTVKCWGNNSWGQLGNGTTTNSPTPTVVTGITDAVAVSANNQHTCALIADGTAQCWGYNAYGQIGNGMMGGNVLVPTPVSGLTDAVAITVGGLHTCALLSDGTVRCWGSNNDGGPLGDGTGVSSATPVEVSGLTGAVAITAGSSHTCALLDDGTARCWGFNLLRSLGTGSTVNSPVPIPVVGLSNAIGISSMGFHTCAVLDDGAVKCWGYNERGQIGNGSTYGGGVDLATVSEIDNAAAIEVGFSHTCALLDDGTVSCWGYNNWGQLGNGSTTDSTTPVAVSGLSGVTTISTGNHGCALLSGRDAKCWGFNTWGQLGDASTADSSVPVPVTVLG